MPIMPAFCFGRDNLRALRFSLIGPRSVVSILAAENVDPMDVLKLYTTALSPFKDCVSSIRDAVADMHKDLITLNSGPRLEPIIVLFTDLIVRSDGDQLIRNTAEWQLRVRVTLDLAAVAVASGQPVCLPFHPLTSAIEEILLVFDQMCGRYRQLIQLYDSVIAGTRVPSSMRLLFSERKRVRATRDMPRFTTLASFRLTALRFHHSDLVSNRGPLSGSFTTMYCPRGSVVRSPSFRSFSQILCIAVHL